MTCIIGLKHKGKIYFGADSVGVQDSNLFPRKDEKIIVKGDFIFGVAGSFRLRDILKYSFIPPKKTCKDVMEYMCTSFVEGLQNCLKEKGVLHIAEGVKEMDSHILLGYKRRIFLIDCDFQIAESSEPYMVIGSCELITLGALAVLIKTKKSPERKILEALEISGRYDGVIRGPFKIVLFNTPYRDS